MVLGRSGRSGRPVSRSFQKGGVRKISRAPCASEKSALRAGNEYCQGRSRASTLEREWLAPARSSSRGENAGALSAYVASASAEFTAIKGVDVAWQTGWLSDRAATFLA